VARSNALGEYLRARRDLMDPASARHDVKALSGGTLRMRHPRVGMLQLRREKLAIGDTGGQLLVIFHAEPGSESARSLALLGAATDAAASQDRLPEGDEVVGAIRNPW
jgi:MmyB-like transcription regulator ligand binding domain